MTSSSSAWSPLEPETVAGAVGPDWEIDLHASLSSTNATAAAAARSGLVVVADHQTSGRGRLDRSWETPPGSALTFSAVLDPALPDADWPLLPLAAALGTADALRAVAGVDAEVKWPNDVLLAGEAEGKVAGILLERVHAADGPLAVVGIGINVGMGADELPVPTATSLRLAGSQADRTSVLAAVLAGLRAETAVIAADREAFLDRYRAACVTLGREVRVDLPDGEVLTGPAEAIDEHGRLVVAGRAVGAGDVVHVRGPMP